MRQFTVSDALSGEHVVKACTVNYPSLKKADLYKALKHKDIRIDGKRVSSDVKVVSGQQVQVWLPDDLFEQDHDELKQRRKDSFIQILSKFGKITQMFGEWLKLNRQANIQNQIN